MQCPKCKSDTDVKDSRHANIEIRATFVVPGIKRRRVCICGHRFTTFELPEEDWKEIKPELDPHLEGLHQAFAALSTHVVAISRITKRNTQ